MYQSYHSSFKTYVLFRIFLIQSVSILLHFSSSPKCMHQTRYLHNQYYNTPITTAQYINLFGDFLRERSSHILAQKAPQTKSNACLLTKSPYVREYYSTSQGSTNFQLSKIKKAPYQIQVMDGFPKKLILSQLVKLFPTISEEQLLVEFKKGHFCLRDVPFPEKYSKLPMFQMKSGTIGLLDIKLSWINLLTQPIQVKLHDVKIELIQTDPIPAAREQQQQQQQEQQRSFQYQYSKGRYGVDNLEVDVKNADIIITNLLDYCSLRVKITSLEMSNKTLPLRKTVSIEHFIFTFGTINDPKYLTLKLDDIDVSIFHGETIHLDFTTKSLTAIKGSHQIIYVGQEIEKLREKKQEQTDLGYSMRIDVKIQPGKPVELYVGLAGVVIEWKSHQIYDVQVTFVKLAQRIKKLLPETSAPYVEENFIRGFLAVQVESLKIFFMNHDTCIGVVRGQTGRISITAKKWEVEVESIAENIEYQDCTNYPFTQQNSIDQYSKHMPFLTTVDKASDRENFRLWIHVYDNDCPLYLVHDQLYNFVEISADNVRLDYYQQPFLRMFDFIVEQLVNLVTRDYGPDCKTRKPVNEWIRTFMDPKFTDIKVSITNSEVRAYPIPGHCKQHFKIPFQELLVTTQPQKCFIRHQEKMTMPVHNTPSFQVDHIWELMILIQVFRAKIYVAEDEKLIRQISNELDLNFQFSKLLFGWEYEQFIKDISKRHDVTGLLNKIHIQLTRFDYLLLMKILMNNILFDDENDSWFLYNFVAEMKLRPTPIRFQLRLVSILMEVVDFQQIQPTKVISVEANDFRLQYTRMKDATSQIEFCIWKVFGDQWSPFMTDFQVMGMLNHYLLRNNPELSARIFQYQEYQEFKPDLAYMNYSHPHYNIDENFQLTYNQKNTNEKNILIKAQKIEGVLNLQWFFHVLNFAYVDDGVYIIFSPGSQKLKVLTLEAILNDTIVFLQSPDPQNLLVLEGDVLISFVKNVNTGIHENFHKNYPVDAEEIIENNQHLDISFEDSDDDQIPAENKTLSIANRLLQQMIDDSPSTTLKAESGRIRVMMCNMIPFQDLGFSRQLYETTQKRELFSPLQVQWKSQNYQCMCTTDHKMLNESCLMLDKFLVQLTYKELQIIIQTVSYLKDSMYQSNLFVNSWNVEPDLQHDDNFIELDKNYKLLSNSKKMFNIQGELLFVNDSGRSLVPLLFIEITSTPLMIEQGYMKFLLSGGVQLQINYYNLSCGQMEPFLEKCSFDVALLRNHDSLPQVSFQLESIGNININIHQQLISLMINTFQGKDTLDESKSRQRKLSAKPETKLVPKEKVRKNTIFESTSPMYVQSNEKITLFQIENQSGYELNISAKPGAQSHSYKILNTQKCNFMSRLDDDLMKMFTTINSVNVDFLTFKGERITMKNVNFDSFNGRQEAWYKYDQENQPHKQQYDFLIYTYVSKLSRVLLITSSLILVNKTQLDLRIQINVKGLKPWTTILSTPQPVPIPVEYLANDADLQFTFHDYSNHLCDPIRFRLKSYVEIKHGPFFTIVKQEQDPIFLLRQNLVFQTPFSIQNCLPVILQVIPENDILQIMKQFPPTQFGTKVMEDRIELDTQNTILLPMCSLTQKLFVRFKVQGLESTELLDVTQPKLTHTFFKENQQKVKVQIKQVFEGKALKIYILPKACLINSSLSALTFYTFCGSRKKIPGQDGFKKVLLLDDQNNLVFGLNEHYSNELSINGVGETSVELKTNKYDDKQVQLNEYGIYITLVCTVPELGLYSKIIQLSPRYVIVNRSSQNLNIQQDNAQGELYYVTSEQRCSLHWSDCRKEKMIVVRIAQGRQYRWSGGIFVSELRSVHFFCQRKDTYEKTYFKAVITKSKATFFISIYDIGEGQYAYKLVNNCKDFHIFYRQNNLDEEKLNYNETTPFAWPQPSQHPILRIRAQNAHKQSYYFKLNLYRFDHQQRFNITPDITIKVQFWFQNQTKIVSFIQGGQSEEVQSNDLVQKISYIRFPYVMVSLISGKRPVELNLLTLGKVQFGSETSNSSTNYQFRVQFIQIDQNNIADPTFKVNLTPQQFKSLASGIDSSKQFQTDSQPHAIDVKFKRSDIQDQIILLDYLTLQILPLNIKIDQEYVQLVLEFVRRLQEDLQEDAKNTFHGYEQLLWVLPLRREELMNQLRENFGQHVDFFQEWQTLKIQDPSKTVYIKDLSLFPLKINFSFQKGYLEEEQQESFFLYRVIANSLGAAISNIEDAPIVLSGFRTENVYDTTQGIFMQLREHYTYGLVKQFMKLIGSIELIGNPLSFFNRISTGVYDLIEKPFGAIAKGPLELGVGIAEGATSLVKHSVGATFHLAEKITGGVSDQITRLTFDRKFKEERRKFMQQKPKHALQGIQQGFYSLFYGLGEGIFGLVQQPYYYGMNEGVEGILKGINCIDGLGSALGVTGLIIKPVTGVLDAASKTAEGISNMATNMDEKPNEERIRPIRPFYGKLRHIKPYSQIDAQIMENLRSYKKGIYSDIELIEIFVLKDIELENEVSLVLSYQTILLITKQGQIKKEIEVNHTEKFLMFQDKNNFTQLIIETKNGEKRDKLQIRFKSTPIQQLLNEKLQQLIS